MVLTESMINSIITSLLPIIIVLIIWTSIWKGIALWKSARKSSIVWFIVLLLVNTIGILEILYIFIFSKIGEKKVSKKKKR